MFHFTLSYFGLNRSLIGVFTTVMHFIRLEIILKVFRPVSILSHEALPKAVYEYKRKRSPQVFSAYTFILVYPPRITCIESRAFKTSARDEDWVSYRQAIGKFWATRAVQKVFMNNHNKICKPFIIEKIICSQKSPFSNKTCRGSHFN